MDALYGIYRYSTKIAFPSKDYDGKITNVHAYNVTLLIRNASDGKKYLYDVMGIKNDAISADSLLKRETARQARSAAKLKGIISNNSIRQTDQNVNPKTRYQPRDEQISVRELLANVIEDASTSADEMAWLKGYRKDLKELDRKLDAISQNKQIIRELMFKKGRTSEESQRLSKARERLKILNEQVARMDEGLKRDYRIDSVFLTALFECLRMYSMVSANTRVINNQQRHLYQMVQTPSG